MSTPDEPSDGCNHGEYGKSNPRGIQLQSKRHYGSLNTRHRESGCSTKAIPKIVEKKIPTTLGCHIDKIICNTYKLEFYFKVFHNVISLRIIQKANCD